MAQPHDSPLALIAELQDTLALSLAKASLDSVGIQYWVEQEDAGHLPGFFGASGIGATPLWKGSIRVFVSKEDAREAEALVESLVKPAE